MRTRIDHVWPKARGRVLGTPEDDLLEGGEGGESLAGFAGADTILGGGGDDTVQGGPGFDVLDGGPGRDLLSYEDAPHGVQIGLYRGAPAYGDGRDEIVLGGYWGELTFEDLRGSAFDDRLTGNRFANLIEGGAGDDTISGAGGTDTLFGGAGADNIGASIEAATLTGGEGADTFRLATGAPDPLLGMPRITDFSRAEGDRLRIVERTAEAEPYVSPPGWSTGGGFVNSIVPYSISAFPHGGWVWIGTLEGSAPTMGMRLLAAEYDIIGWHAGWLPDPAGGGWVLLDRDGDGVFGARDRVIRFDGAPGFAIGADDFPDLRFSAQRAGPAGERLVGSDIIVPADNPGFDPVLPATDILLGGAGNDTLIGLDGADFLADGKGADIMIGGAGGDTYVVDDPGDIVSEKPDTEPFYILDDFDTVIVSFSYRLPRNVETLILRESAEAIKGTGNDGMNFLFGNSLDNRLMGRGGFDQLDGGAGNDSLFGEAGNDVLYGGGGNDRLAGGDGNDTVRGEEGADRLIGGNGNDSLIGGAGPDTLVGGAGADTLRGGEDDLDDDSVDRLFGDQGDDFYIVEASGTRILEFAGFGADTILADLGEPTVFRIPDHVEGLILGWRVGTGIGNSADNIIEGSLRADRLEGMSGQDTLIGGGGADTLVGGDRADLFVMTLHGGADVILDFQPGVDRIRYAAVDPRLVDFADVRAVLTDTAEGVRIGSVYFGAPTLLLTSVSAASLTEGDFLFG
ncbi:calcium-binding protein [Falsiroseomonas bella]|nr:calcium-binding protein [Falsiroseomonas bella]